jgi:hypothetical protein
MIKIIKRIVLSSLSILGISFLIWIVFLLNPHLSYANQTQIDNVLIFHNQELEEGTDLVIRNALSIIRNADIYDKDIDIQLCLNDDKIYPNLYPFAGATAYAFLNKTVIYASKPSFKNNHTEFSWEINNYEIRKWNLTSLLAHEFMHNLQNHHNQGYYIKSTLGNLNWKFEGHAEYIAREFKHDDRLKDKIKTYHIEEEKEHVGIPVIVLDNGTIQSLSYFKFALVVQYLIEIKMLTFDEICKLEIPLDDLYSEMIDWNDK